MEKSTLLVSWLGRSRYLCSMHLVLLIQSAWWVSFDIFDRTQIDIQSQVAAGGILGVFKPVERPAFPTPERVIESVSSLKVDILFAIPVFLEVSLSVIFLIP